MTKAAKGMRRDPPFDIIRGDDDGLWHANGQQASVMLTPDVAERFDLDPHTIQTSVFQKLIPGDAREYRILKINLGDYFIYVMENNGEPEDVGNPPVQVIISTKTLNL